MAVKKPRKDDGYGDGGGNGENGEPREPDEEGPEAIEVHEAYAAQYLGGGAPAKIEAFRRGAEQFSRLPGALPRRVGGKQRSPANPKNKKD